MCDFIIYNFKYSLIYQSLNQPFAVLFGPKLTYKKDKNNYLSMFNLFRCIIITKMLNNTRNSKYAQVSWH